MDQNFLKITYHLGGNKLNAYLNMPSPTFHVLRKEIEMCLFEERKQPRCEIRTYWIDEDQDEIEIVNQCDYEIFMAKRSERKHLQVAPLNAKNNEENIQKKSAEEQDTPKETPSSNSNQSKVPPAEGSYDYAVHYGVECDSCLMSPIVGFRYKCIQCPNYDLCQNCESKHIHSEHMMVRMPTNNCPGVVEAYITGRGSGSGRRHGKRSKTSCPFVKTGISVVIDDDDNNANNTGGENGEKSDSPGAKERHHGRKHHHRRHQRHNFFSHLYEMMHDLAEGGGAAAAAHAMGEEAPSTAKTTTTTTTTSSSSSTGPETTTKTFTSTSANANAKDTPIPENPIAAAAAAAAANFAAQHAHEAAKVAHETAMKVAKNMTENIVAGAFQTATPSSSSTSTQKETEANKETTGEKKTDASTSPTDSNGQCKNTPVIPSPSMETLAQFLDPQYMKTGIQILNNFSDMFAKMLDPMDGSESNENQIYPNLRKNSATTSTKSSVASNLNSMDSEKKSENEQSVEKEQTKENEKQADSDVSSHVEIDDLGSDSENDSVSESFIKLDAPTKDSNVTSNSTSKASTPPQSLDKSEKIMDFAQLSADLKAHIAQEANDVTDMGKTTTATITSTTTIASEPVVTTTTSTSSMTSHSSNASTENTTPKKPEEKRAVPVYHADQNINNAVHAMMAMGFSNEGAWLTQLLESVNGNIPEALDLMTVTQRNGGR